MARAAPSLVLLSLLAACATQPGLRPFVSDGCSWFPDRALVGKADWCSCCLAHDLAYWKGGTEEQRRQADRQLRDCVATKTGDAILAENMQAGVRAGGSPALPTPFRWAYGWPAGRGYQPLDGDEAAEASRLEEQWRAAGAAQPCRHAD